jgi:hypothetical protein
MKCTDCAKIAKIRVMVSAKHVLMLARIRYQEIEFTTTGSCAAIAKDVKRISRITRTRMEDILGRRYRKTRRRRSGE